MSRSSTFPLSRLATCSLLVGTLALGACGQGVKKSLGLERNTPDEFAVVERAPLTLPPNYQLVAPQPGASRPQEQTAANTARGLVLRSEPSAPKAISGLSTSENALLNKAGSQKADPAIRTQLATDKHVNEDPNRPVIEKIGLRGNADIEQGKALDASAEAQRLKDQNIKAPQPAPAPSKKK
jgi:hypothetical protein